jgi:hypothetical protein
MAMLYHERDMRVPAEFEDLLSRAGRKVLAGTHSLCGALADPRRRFVASEELLDRVKASRVRRILGEALEGALEPIAKPIPPETTPSFCPRLPAPARSTSTAGASAV